MDDWESASSFCANNSWPDQTISSFFDRLSAGLWFQRELLPWLVLPLSCLSVISNCLFIFFAFRAIRGDRVSTRRYTCLLSRSFSDLLAGAFIIFADGNFEAEQEHLFVRLADYQVQNLSVVPPMPPILHYLDMVMEVNFVVLGSSYISLALLMFIAVKWPFFYKRSISSRKVVVICVVNWILGVGYAVAAHLAGSLGIFVPLDYAATTAAEAHKNCDRALVVRKNRTTEIFDCVDVFAYMSIALTSACYVLVILTYFGVQLFLRTHSRLAMISGKTPKVGRKLLSNIVNFALLCLPMVVASALPVAFYRNLESSLTLLGNDESKGFCAKLNHLNDDYVLLLCLSALADILWILRAVIDPLLNMLSDYKQIVPCFVVVQRPLQMP